MPEHRLFYNACACNNNQHCWQEHIAQNRWPVSFGRLHMQHALSFCTTWVCMLFNHAFLTMPFEPCNAMQCNTGRVNCTHKVTVQGVPVKSCELTGCMLVANKLRPANCCLIHTCSHTRKKLRSAPKPIRCKYYQAKERPSARMCSATATYCFTY